MPLSASDKNKPKLQKIMPHHLQRITMKTMRQRPSKRLILGCLTFVSSFGVLHLLIPLGDVETNIKKSHSTAHELRRDFQVGERSHQHGGSRFLIQTTTGATTTSTGARLTTNIRHMDMQDARPNSQLHFDDRLRIFFFDNDNDNDHPLPSKNSRTVVPMGRNDTKNDPNHYIHPYEQPFYDECTPMANWQQTHHPTCNIVHALDSSATSLLSLKGSWRSAWKLSSNNTTTTVLKMLHLGRDFDEESFSHHQIDIRIMEQLTWSPFVVDAYSFCGQSVVTEWAPQDVRSLMKDPTLTARDRLLLARDLARGLNHIHSLDYRRGTNATFSHNDINMANLVNTHDRVIKYNDFNIGAMMRWNKTEPCGYPVRFEGKLWRSPEEILNTSYVSEKTDMYAFGNVLFQVLTKHQPWTWLEPGGKLELEDVARKKLAGEFPHFPRKFLKMNRLASQGLHFATLSCYQLTPKDRPTAYQLARGLHQVLLWYDEGVQKSIQEVAELFFDPFNYDRAL